MRKSRHLRHVRWLVLTEILVTALFPRVTPDRPRVILCAAAGASGAMRDHHRSISKRSPPNEEQHPAGSWAAVEPND